MKHFYFLLWLQLLIVSATFSQYSGGTGTQADPYQIATLNDLISLSQTSADWNKYFIQTADINAAATSTMNGGSGFKPIGDRTRVFNGTYNGNGHTINNLFINRPTEDSVGLFGVVENPGKIQNLGVVNADVTGRSMVGILVGRNLWQLTNCYTTGSVKSVATDYGRCGGLAGSSNGAVTNCYSHANVESAKSIAGGLIGLNVSTLTECFATGNVTGEMSTGGLTGISNGSISKCHALGNVSGTSRVGGLVGAASPAANIYISNSYARGNVTSTSGYSGGFIGVATTDKVFITKCYSTGSINTGSAQLGGFAGSFSTPANITSCFWDTVTSGYTTSQGGTGLSTADLTNMQTFLNAGWDFVCETANGSANIWGINNTDNSGYPFLYYQGYSYDFTPPQILSQHLNDTLAANENCQAVLPDYLPLLQATDNCTPANLLSKIQTPDAGTVISGPQTVVLRVSDNAGNTSEMSFTVEVSDQTPPIILSSHSDVELDVNENCQAILPDFTSLLVANDNCSLSENLIVSQIPEASTIIVAPQSVTLQVNDQAGNFSMVSFLVTPIDTLKPILICRSDTTIILNMGETSYTVLADELQPLTFSDNCQIASIYNSFNESDHLAGAVIPAGTHIIQWFISDASGNSESCQFNLSVQLYTGLSHKTNSIRIYPNPVSECLYLEDIDSESKMVLICNVEGKILYEFQWDGSFRSFDVSGFPSGLYIVTIRKRDTLLNLFFAR